MNFFEKKEVFSSYSFWVCSSSEPLSGTAGCAKTHCSSCSWVCIDEPCLKKTILPPVVTSDLSLSLPGLQSPPASLYVQYLLCTRACASPDSYCIHLTHCIRTQAFIYATLLNMLPGVAWTQCSTLVWRILNLFPTWVLRYQCTPDCWSNFFKKNLIATTFEIKEIKVVFKSNNILIHLFKSNDFSTETLSHPRLLLNSVKGRVHL